MLAILNVPSATLANCRTASYMTCGAYAAVDDINVLACVNLTSTVRPHETSLAIQAPELRDL